MKNRCLGFFLIAGSVASPLRAACNLPPPVRQQIEQLERLPTGLARYNRGLTYYDFRCYSEAVTELQEAVTVLAANSQPSPREKELLGLSRSALALNQAHLTMANDRSSGIAQILGVAERTAPSVVKVIATMDLVRILDPKAPEWARLDSQLEQLAEQGYWQATKVVAGKKAARGEDAAAYVRQRLSNTERIEESHALRILLADLWRSSGRTLEAWLLVRMDEEDAGTEILDVELRLEFLRVAKAVAEARGRTGDADAARAAQVYSAALQQTEASIR
jgi:hypothetical protein